MQLLIVTMLADVNVNSNQLTARLCVQYHQHLQSMKDIQGQICDRVHHEHDPSPVCLEKYQSEIL